MLTLVVVIIALLIYIVYTQTTRNARIKKVEKMRRNHASFDDRFGKLGASDTLSWEQLKRITSVSEEEMRKSDEAYRKKEERKRIEAENAKEFNRIKDNFPYGVRLFEKRNPNSKHTDYIANKYEIERLDKAGRRNEEFLKTLNSQIPFAEKSRSLLPQNWGCRLHEISVKHENEYGDNTQSYPYKFWNLFIYPFCKDETLDYSFFPVLKSNYESLNNFISCRTYLANSIFDKIADYIRSLSDDVSVVFVGPLPPHSMDGTIYDEQYAYLKNQLSMRNIFTRNLNLYFPSLIRTRDLVLVDYISNDDAVKKACSAFVEELIFNQYQPHITYISIFREFGTDEVLGMISKKKREQEEREEQRRREAERRRVEEERRRQEAERQRTITNSLKSAVSSWGNVPNSELHHEYLIRYYPTTCDFDATDSEWNDRQLIWSFKNDPNKETRISHQQALNNLIPRVKNRLESTFGNLLPNLTLVCIPASSPEKNKARYELFAELLCRGTGMSNAYSHITINSERTARHEGGAAGGTDSIIFDEAYFKGKNILLFDDVLTRGDSMRRFKSKLSAMGANVIAGFTIGKTFHNREVSPLSYHPSFTSTNNDYLDDLPF